MQYIVLDDGSDTSRAVQNTRKLIDEDHVDAIIGSTVTPNSLAMLDRGCRRQDADDLDGRIGGDHLADGREAAWAFKTPQNDSLMADAIADYMEKHGVKTVGFIGFADAYGDGWNNVFSAAATAHNLKIVTNERYQPHGHVGDRPGAEDDGRESGRGADRGRGHAVGAAGEGAQGARLQGQGLSDARRRQQRLPARVRQGLRRRDCCRPVRCSSPISCRTAIR